MFDLQLKTFIIAHSPGGTKGVICTSIIIIFIVLPVSLFVSMDSHFVFFSRSNWFLALYPNYEKYGNEEHLSAKRMIMTMM